MWIYVFFVVFLTFVIYSDVAVAVQLTITPPIVGIGEPVALRCSGLRHDSLKYLSIYRLTRADKNIVRMNQFTSAPLFPNSDVIGQNASVVVGSDYLEVKVGRVICSDVDTYVCSYRETSVHRKAEAELIVRVSPQIEVTAVPPTEVHVGAKVKVQCSGLLGNPPNNMTWVEVSPDGDTRSLHNVSMGEAVFDSQTCSYRRNSSFSVVASVGLSGTEYRCSVNGVKKSFVLEVTDPNEVIIIAVAVLGGFLAVLGIVAVVIYCVCKHKCRKDWKKQDINNSQMMLCSNEVSQISIMNNFQRPSVSYSTDSQKSATPFTVSNSRIYGNLDKGKTYSDSALHQPPRMPSPKHEKQGSFDRLSRKYNAHETPILSDFRKKRDIPSPLQLEKDMEVLPQNIKTPTIDKNLPIENQFSYIESYPEFQQKPNNLDDNIVNSPRSRQNMYQASGQTIFPDLASSAYSPDHVLQKKQLNSTRKVSRSQSVSSSIPSQGVPRDPFEPYTVSGLEVESTIDSPFTPNMMNTFSFPNSSPPSDGAKPPVIRDYHRPSFDAQHINGQHEMSSYHRDSFDTGSGASNRSTDYPFNTGSSGSNRSTDYPFVPKPCIVNQIRDYRDLELNEQVSLV